MLEHAAGRHSLRGIDRLLADIHVLDDASLVDNEGRALRQFVARVPYLLEPERDSILLKHLVVLVAQQWKVNIQLPRECCIRCRTIAAYSEDNGVACFQLWPISLIGF